MGKEKELQPEPKGKFTLIVDGESFDASKVQLPGKKIVVTETDESFHKTGEGHQPILWGTFVEKLLLGEYREGWPEFKDPVKQPGFWRKLFRKNMAHLLTYHCVRNTIHVPFCVYRSKLTTEELQSLFTSTVFCEHPYKMVTVREITTITSKRLTAFTALADEMSKVYIDERGEKTDEYRRQAQHQ